MVATIPSRRHCSRGNRLGSSDLRSRSWWTVGDPAAGECAGRWAELIDRLVAPVVSRLPKGSNTYRIFARKDP